jgi:uncharacterized protein (DUF1501 family)
MKRRDVLKALPLGVAAAGLPIRFPGLPGKAYAKSPLLDAILGNDSSDRVLVLINLQGGNDGLNTIVPFQDSAYDTNRSTIGFISSSDKAKLASTTLSTSISRGDLAINPLMADNTGISYPTFYDMFKAGKVAVVNNVGYPDPNRSHFRSTDIWNTASDSNVVLTTGWLGRWLENVDTNYPVDVNPGDDPLAITIGGAMNPVFQGTRSGLGIAVSDPSHYVSASMPADETLPATHAGAELGFVRSIYLQSDIYGTRFGQLFASKPTNKVTYPKLANGNLTSIAAQLQKVAWCVAAGMKTKVYFVQQGGYDTHINENSSSNTAGQGMLLYQLSQAIAAFQADLEAFGVADRVIGMTYSEFGRRVNENASNGTDHGTCAPQFVFGTGVNGEVYSSNPNLTDLDSNEDLKWKIDFRQLYTAVLGDWFGVSEPLRKAILMDKTTNGEQFSSLLSVNGSSTMQSVIKSPAAVSSPKNDIDFVLEQYPNPFTSSTNVHVAVPKTMQVRLEVYSERGDLVTSILDRELSRGTYDFTFDARKLSSGTYLCRMEAGGQVAVRQMKLVK